MSRVSKAFWLALVAALSSVPALAGDYFEVDGLALRGYDPVAYIEVHRPTPGKPEHAIVHKGSRFLFASAENQRKFAADPERYAPQFGGFCALGTANGYKVATEPDAFAVVNGKLYLNYNRQVLDLWTEDQASYIERAERNWPEVSKQPLRE
jgi:YHS domain-containing protein